MKITKVPRMRDRHKKRVAAYCRVSTRLGNQEESFRAQTAYYTQYIEAHTEWEFAGIYSDEKSATKASNRPGFQKLVQDALDGKVDYILVKSISRFSRNIVDCQKYANMLQSHGCYIHFEKEGLDTEDPSCSMMFSFLSVIAQDESRSISDNVRWAYHERYKRGEYTLGSNRVLGYDWVDGRLVPNEDAWIVRAVYQMFLEGKGEGQIAAILEGMGVRGRQQKPITSSGITYILSNEVYVGDRILQKQAPRNYLTRYPDKNQPFESVYLRDDHEAVIDRSRWEEVQTRLKARRNEIESGIKYHGGRTHFLYGRIFCGECGAPMTRRTLRSYTGKSGAIQTYKAWTCRERHMGRKGNGCRNRTVREELVLEAVWKKYGAGERISAEELLPAGARIYVSAKGIEIR